MDIRQLAKELRLSIGTVSRALNDRPGVSAETRARVKAAAAQAGYVPNQAGRSLRSGRTGIVAATIPTSRFAQRSDPGMFRVIEGARRTLLRASLDLILLFRGPEEDPLENLQRIVQRRIADAIIISDTTAGDPRLSFLKAADISYVVFGRSAGIEDYCFVDFDFDAMAAEAARVFFRDGHRRLALAGRERPMNYETIVAAAFRDEAARLGLGSDAVCRLPCREARLNAEGRAALADAAPTAILATHESIASGLYADLGELGRTVGDEISVICTFPALATRDLRPALSHFDADLDAVGAALAERLIPLLPGRAHGAQPGSALMPLTFAPRASHGRAQATG